MLHSLPDFLTGYWMYLAGAALLLFVLGCFSEKCRSFLIKALLLFAMVFILACGYELLSGRSIFTLPERLDQKLSENPSETETGRRYYKSYEERYGDDAPK